MLTALHPSRRSFIVASTTAFATAGFVKSQARAAQYEFRCGSAYTLEHPSTVRMTQMWAAIERESGGRIHTQLFPNSSLGGAPAMLSQVRLGALHFVITGSILSSVVPAADISFIGFAFRDNAEGFRVHDGPLGTYIRDQSAAKGMHLMRTIWDSGMRQVGSTTRAVRVPDDLRGFKIKVLGKIAVDLFKDLGANPVEMPLGETYTGLQTKLVDGEDSPLDAIESQRFFEVNKYVSMTNHGWSGLWVIANGEMWKSLPPDLQEIIERNNTKYSLLDRRDAKVFSESIADKLRRQGITFIAPVDQAPFRQRLRSYYDYWAGAFGTTAWGLLESSLGHRLG
jgi:TRAP-type transport system periplasmic protein